MAFNKPTPLSWSSSLQERATLLASYRSHTLPDVWPLVEAMHAMEDLADVLQSEPSNKAPKSPSYQELQLKVANQPLSNLPTFAAVSIHTTQLILRSSPHPDPATLIQHACAIKEYTADLLSRPAIQLHHLAAVEWTNLLETLLLTARLSRPLPASHGWDSGAVASTLQPESTLDSVSAHMAAAPAADPLAPRDEPLLAWFRDLCESLKQRVRLERSGGEGFAPVWRAGVGLWREGDGYEVVKETEGADARFRAVNEERARPRADPPTVPGGRDFFELLRNGILDERFWFASGL
ncbi:hypothetical protein MBLNU230_g1181t1 [Neophaeotheca triangularis]